MEEQASPGDVLQIHGSHDVLFPPRYVGKAFLMGAGMHLMILEKAGIIEQIITSTLPEGQISNLQIASAMRPSGYNVN